MNMWSAVLTIGTCYGVLVAQTPPKTAAANTKTNAKVGEMAPDFTLPSTTGKDITLSDYRGKKNVVLAFIVKAFTGGWTKEAQGYQAGIQKFESGETQVLMISMDDQDTLKRWAQELKVTYPMLSDATGRVTEAYGVMMPNQRLAIRTTFVIDKSGVIRDIQQGGAAIDTSGALAACERVSHQKPEKK